MVVCANGERVAARTRSARCAEEGARTEGIVEGSRHRRGQEVARCDCEHEDAASPCHVRRSEEGARTTGIVEGSHHRLSQEVVRIVDTGRIGRYRRVCVAPLEKAARRLPRGCAAGRRVGREAKMALEVTVDVLRRLLWARGVPTAATDDDLLEASRDEKHKLGITLLSAFAAAGR